MARIPRKFIANDGTEFATAAEARAYNDTPPPDVAAFLAQLEVKPRKVPEYARLIATWEVYMAPADAA